MCHGNQIWCEQKMDQRPRKMDLREACAGVIPRERKWHKTACGQHNTTQNKTATTKNGITRRLVRATSSRPNKTLTKEHPDPEITQGKN
jgi:hypothetical protein